MKKYSETIVKNESGWMVGKNVSQPSMFKTEVTAYPHLQVTYADLAITVLLDALAKYKPELLAAFPALGQLKTSVETLPNITKWMARRPDSSH